MDLGRPRAKAVVYRQIPYGTYELQVEVPEGYLSPEAVQLLVSEDVNGSIDFALNRVTDVVYLPVISR